MVTVNGAYVPTGSGLAVAVLAFSTVGMDDAVLVSVAIGVKAVETVVDAEGVPATAFVNEQLVAISRGTKRSKAGLMA